MKNYIKTIAAALLVSTAMISCDDHDTELPQIVPAVYSESFTPAEGTFNFTGWTNFAEAGTKTWFKNAFGGNDYIEFSSFGSSQPSNIGWAIMPAINIDQAAGKKLIFQSAQHHATVAANKLEVLVSENFDGTNVLAATWTPVSFKLPSYTNATNYDFVNSGAVDLSAYSGEIHIAFRVTGNGTTLTGGFQIDNIKIF